MTVSIHHASCLDWLAEYDGPLFDACVTDPPYHLTSIVKRFGGKNAAEAKEGATGAYARASKGFMGKEWDGGDIAFQPETWRAIYDVLKPGAHLVAFSGTRTYHRMACAIEDAGFEIRDQLGWAYGAGFPKSHNISKALSDIRCDCERTGSPPECNLRPVPCTDVSEAVSSKDERREILFEGVPQQSASGAMLWPESSQGIEARSQSSLEGRGDVQESPRQLSGRQIPKSAGMGVADGAQGRLHNAASTSDGADVRVPNDANGSGESYRPQSSEQSPKQSGTVADECGSQAGGSWPICGRCGKPNIAEGLGTALKPSWEPICLARKPLSEKSVAANVLKHGTGALNIDACRVGENAGWSYPNGRGGEGCFGKESLSANITQAMEATKGRWPANLCWTVPCDEYELREDISPQQKREVMEWLYANS